MFDAVCERLRNAALEPGNAKLREVIGSCVQDLGLLRTAQASQRGYLQRIESELRQASDELAHSRASETEARHQAAHDGLTQLPNRGQFRRRLDDALALAPTQPPALAVLFLDLDDFKPINDRHGHDTGDELLRIVARRLSDTVQADDIVCRLGGDEFACLLSRPIAHAQLVELVGRLFDAVSAPLTLGAVELKVRPSIGIAICPSDGATTTELLQRADAAMYRAKRSGLGFAFFDDLPEAAQAASTVQ